MIQQITKITGRKVIKTNQWQHHPQGPNSFTWCESHEYTKQMPLKWQKPTWHESNPTLQQSSCPTENSICMLASDPAKPSTEKHRGVKWARCVAQASAYLFFFSTSAFNKTDRNTLIEHTRHITNF